MGGERAGWHCIPPIPPATGSPRSAIVMGRPRGAAGSLVRIAGCWGGPLQSARVGISHPAVRNGRILGKPRVGEVRVGEVRVSEESVGEGRMEEPRTGEVRFVEERASEIRAD